MLTVLMDSAKLQHLRDYASAHDMSMGAIVNQLVDNLLAGEPNQLPLEQNADLYIANVEKSIDKLMAKKVDDYHKSMMGMITTELLSQDKSIHSMVTHYIDNNNKSIGSKIASSIEANNKTLEELIALSIETDNKSVEEFVTASIESRLETLPPTLSLLDVDRLIGSAVGDLKNIIGNQGAEIDRLSKIVGELMTSNNPKPPTTTAIQPLNADSLSWGDFCKMIDEPLPKERNKATGDRIVVMASNKGFNSWRYDGKSKKFTQPPNFSSP